MEIKSCALSIALIAVACGNSAATDSLADNNSGGGASIGTVTGGSVGVPESVGGSSNALNETGGIAAATGGNGAFPQETGGNAWTQVTGGAPFTGGTTSVVANTGGTTMVNTSPISGGAMTTGGMKASGGAPSTGGTTSVVSTGGLPGTGGSKAAGGSMAIGGSSSPALCGQSVCNSAQTCTMALCQETTGCISDCNAKYVVGSADDIACIAACNACVSGYVCWPPVGTGGSSSSGGSSATGGNVATGGFAATGGALNTGGATSPSCGNLVTLSTAQSYHVSSYNVSSVCQEMRLAQSGQVCITGKLYSDGALVQDTELGSCPTTDPWQNGVAQTCIASGLCLAKYHPTYSLYLVVVYNVSGAAEPNCDSILKCYGT